MARHNSEYAADAAKAGAETEQYITEATSAVEEMRSLSTESRDQRMT